MSHRNTILEIFSSFLQFEDDFRTRWIAQSNLVRSMRRCLSSQDSEGDHVSLKHIWAYHWYEKWSHHQAKLPQDHLFAYLQEAGYYAAKKSVDFSKDSESSADSSQSLLSLGDRFFYLMNEVPKILSTYNPERGASISTFVQITFNDRLKNYLRKMRVMDRATEWKILRYESDIIFCESLTICGGLSERQLQQYRLARRYFNEYYTETRKPGQGRLPPPDKETWQQIINAYNKARLTQLTFSTPEVDFPTIRLWLEDNAVTWIRDYLYSSPSSGNERLSQGDGDVEFQDIWLPDEADISAAAQLFKLETQENFQEMSILLEEAIANLPQEHQEYLHLYYRKDVSQTQIARDHNIKQYTVSRALNKARTSLLKTLIQWSKTKTPDLDEQALSETAKGLSDLLEVWLQEVW